MNSEEQNLAPGDSLETIDADDTSSVDDFIKELEAKEKDLHITADLTIEIADSDFEMSVPEFAKQDVVIQPIARENGQEPAASSSAKVRNFELENEIAALRVRVMELKAERNETQQKSDRRLKDFENFKYRMDRERRGAFIDQIGNLATQMLPVLDNLNRALDSADETAGERSPEFQQFFDGIVLVNQQVNDVFAGMGVQPINSIGEEFDPNFHEAVATEENSDLPPNTVSHEMLRGYRIGNRVIRHSMVRVTTAPVTSKFDTPTDLPEEVASSPEAE